MKHFPVIKTLLPAALAACLYCLPATYSQAQDTTPPAAEVGNDLSRKLPGYWMVDFDSAATKAFIANEGIDGEVRQEMADTTFDFKEGEILAYKPGETDVVKITIKAMNSEKRTITTDFLAEGEDEAITMTVTVDNDRLTLMKKDDNGEESGIGLKRISRQQFEERVPENRRNRKPVPDFPKNDGNADDRYPTAKPVPNQPGFVFSPYNDKVIDVSDLPSGMLAADPHFPIGEKKYFRVP